MGLHITLIGTGVLTLLGLLRIPLPVRAAAALAVIYLYGKMIGMGTSVFRAIVMFSLYIIAKAIGRTYDLLTAAGIACLLLLLDQPLYFLHTGFLFTFAAVLSIGILIPALPGKVLKILAVPLGTIPVCLWMNGTFPLFSLLLNLVVIPLMTAVMASAGLAVLIGTAGSAAVSAREAFTIFCSGASMTARIAGNCAVPAQGVAASSGSVTLLIARIAGLPAELTSLLKVAHHGSRNATSDEFLASFHADFAVISAGVNNMYGHPNPELLQRLTDAGISCDRTDQSGMITVGIKNGAFYVRDYLTKANDKSWDLEPCAHRTGGEALFPILKSLVLPDMHPQLNGDGLLCESQLQPALF